MVGWWLDYWLWWLAPLAPLAGWLAGWMAIRRERKKARPFPGAQKAREKGGADCCLSGWLALWIGGFVACWLRGFLAGLIVGGTTCLTLLV